MNIKESLDWGKKQLGAFEYPFLESEILLAHALDQTRAFLKMFPFYDLEEEEVFLYKKFIQKRKEFIPVAYIIGHKEWGELELYIDESVLIPRDETENLCHLIRDTEKSPKSILDIGTGSGAIALFLKKSFPSASLMGVDISKEALIVAQKNADTYKMDIDFRESDLLDTVPMDSWDILVANLPYLPAHLSVSLDVRKEPSLALFSGEDGLDLIRRLEEQLTQKKVSFGSLWLEFLPKQKNKIEQIFSSYKILFQKNIEGQIFFARISRRSDFF